MDMRKRLWLLSAIIRVHKNIRDTSVRKIRIASGELEGAHHGHDLCMWSATGCQKLSAQMLPVYSAYSLDLVASILRLWGWQVIWTIKKLFCTPLTLLPGDITFTEGYGTQESMSVYKENKKTATAKTDLSSPSPKTTWQSGMCPGNNQGFFGIFLHTVEDWRPK